MGILLTLVAYEYVLFLQHKDILKCVNMGGVLHFRGHGACSLDAATTLSHYVSIVCHLSGNTMHIYQCHAQVVAVHANPR